MEKEVQKTGIIYTRVSSLEQVEGTSLESQEKICRNYAEKENIEILEVFVERGESAKTANRTEFSKAIVFCSNKKQKINYFIVYKLDRFARNQDDHGVVRGVLKKYGTDLRSATEPINETPVGRLMEGVISSVAEFDNSIRSERSKGGMIEKVKQGFWVWRPPMGYKRLSKGGNLVVDDEIAPYIKMAFEEYAKGTYSYRSLSDFLEERGFRTRTGKKPCQQLMEKIIRNPIYCGLIRVWGQETKGVFAAIIDEELFIRCQPELRRKFHSGKRELDNPNFPLRRFVICSECGQSLTGSFSTGRKGVKYPYYHHHKQTCSSARFIPKETLEQNFIEFLKEASPKPKYEKIFKAIMIDVWQSNYKKLDSENTRIRKEVEVLETERQRVFDLHRAHKYNDQEFLDQKDHINLKIQQKKLLLEEKRIEEFNMEEALDYCFRFVRESAKTWLELADLPLQRARFQQQIFPEKITFDGEKFGTAKMSLIYELNKQAGNEKSNLVTPRGIEPRLLP